MSRRPLTKPDARHVAYQRKLAAVAASGGAVLVLSGRGVRDWFEARALLQQARIHGFDRIVDTPDKINKLIAVVEKILNAVEPLAR